MTDKVIPLPDDATTMTTAQADYVHIRRQFISDDKLLAAAAAFLEDAKFHQRMVDEAVSKAGQCLACLHTGIRIHMKQEVKS